MTIEEKLFGLLREALWGMPFNEPVSPEEAKRLISMAEKQTVAGLVIDTLIKKDVRMERQTVFEAFSYLEQIKQQNRAMNAEVAAFARLMADTQTEYLIVKGQTLAALYPNPLLRMPGDIDFLAKDYCHAAEVLKTHWSISLPNSLAEKETAFTHGTALYELHTYLIDFGSNRHKRYWEKTLTESTPIYIIIGGAQVAVMEPTLYVAYVFIHLFFHFVHEGIGLRHLCDWAVIMHHYAHEIDMSRLTELLQGVGLLKAFKAFGCILVEQLGMTDFPYSLDAKDRKFQQRILKDILHGGNFGRENRNVRKAGLMYKAETMWKVLSNSMRYLSLAPWEMFLQMHRRMVVNLKILFHGES